ncbi:unnamed protein product [Lota lota]
MPGLRDRRMLCGFLLFLFSRAVLVSSLTRFDSRPGGGGARSFVPVGAPGWGPNRNEATVPLGARRFCEDGWIDLSQRKPNPGAWTRGPVASSRIGFTLSVFGGYSRQRESQRFPCFQIDSAAATSQGSTQLHHGWVSLQRRGA